MIEPLGANESIKSLKKPSNNNISQLTNEIKIYSESSHLKGISENIVELYESLKQYILNFGDDIAIRATKTYIGFILPKKSSGLGRKTNFCDIAMTNTKIKIWINLEYNKLNDPLKLSRDMTNISHWGNGDCEIQINSSDNLEYIIGLIKQSYHKIN